MHRHNNWMFYDFDGTSLIKNNPKSKFNLHFNIPDDTSIMSYRAALFYNASVLRDTFQEPFDVLLSGGIDSEVMVRAFKELGIAHNTFIVKFENDLNKQDVDGAVEVCKCLNIPYKILDFNIENHFKGNGAYDCFQKSFIAQPGSLVKIAWLDMLDNIPVLGEGEPYWRRVLGGDYSQKSEWKLRIAEIDFFMSLYGVRTNRTIIGEWYYHTPQITLSYHKLPIVQNLLADKATGRQSCWSSRVKIHREIWPDIRDNSKGTGFEKVTDYFIEFYNLYLKDHVNSEYSYSLDQVDSFFR